MIADRHTRARYRKSNAWIGRKIQKLEHEGKGRSHEQNIAIAESMAGNSRPRKNAASESGGHHASLCEAVRELRALVDG